MQLDIKEGDVIELRITDEDWETIVIGIVYIIAWKHKTINDGSTKANDAIRSAKPAGLRNTSMCMALHWTNEKKFSQSSVAGAPFAKMRSIAMLYTQIIVIQQVRCEGCSVPIAITELVIFMMIRKC